MIRKHKKYSKPRKPFEKKRIEEENELIRKYGLKSKREIWKANAQVTKMRSRAKDLIQADNEEREKFFNKLKKSGFKVNSTSDVLALTKEDYLNRRLQTVVFKRSLANSPKMARQMITHKNVLVEGRVVSSPSYIVPLDLEDKIKLKKIFIKNTEKEIAIANG